MLDLISRRKTPEILIALLNRPYYIRELKRVVGGSSTTIVKRVKELEEAGLIEIIEIPSFPFKKKVLLTEKGRAVATYVKYAMEI